jgi:hypothetical protein
MIEILPRTLTSQQIQIIKTVLYFDVFKYPLTPGELFENCALKITMDQFTDELNFLTSNGLILRQGDFISSSERTKKDIELRLKGNSEAQKIMPMAYRYSKKIASFPFVQGVCLSGGLSKNYYDENSDIDFFIITSPARLWLCRTLLILRYKLLPKHLKKYWCTNYFISADDLSLPDKNAFTATELAFLIPTVNYSLYKNLLDNNQWYKKQYPNKPSEGEAKCMELPSIGLKQFVESLLSGRSGKWLDDTLLKITHKHWKNKYPEMSPEDFELQFRSKKNVCKRHTKGFQNKVLKRWQEKQLKFEQQFKISLQ